MRIQWALAALLLVSCATQPKSEPAAPAEARQPARAGNVVEEHVGQDHANPSAAFEEKEKEPRRHSFILVDKKGHFGYHISAFVSNHQHQVIVRSETTMKGKDQAGVAKFLSGKAKNGIFTLTSDAPPFPLKEVRDGVRKKWDADMYDGIIGSGTKVEGNAGYEVQKILFTTPMHVEDSKLADSTYIVFGSYDKPTTTYYLAHLIWGPKNHDQLVAVEFDKPVTIENGTLMKIEAQKDADPLADNTAYKGIVKGETLGFKVTRQIYNAPITNQ